MYLKLKGDNHNSVLINIDHIDFVFEEKNGCRIYFAGTNITAEAKLEDIEKALLNAYQEKLNGGGGALEKE